ncbi:hypothetical protein F975_00200 [Acinetobacter sp. ANC 3789]|uniref:DUF4124 domain-containing protein n=1 Tax=unclassified Acinetobacter TaxID=196816 RepID=UPI0002CD75FF|nr:MULTISPECIES: DUF4124 domain-containing protein [unclassified Acinetobacter]ENU81591.1 hypothetical protein F975_00200 [Acinetobacter sp. ANC 3789]TCB84474.1 DUF4124 domain-containing protein [Acinetobacter sp. ANC 3791]
MKTLKQITISSMIGLGLMGLSQISLAQQDYYKWIDAHGSTHYTTTPPPKAKGVKTRGKIQTHGWATTPTPSTTNTNNDNTDASQKNTSQPVINHVSSTQNQPANQQSPLNNQENLPVSAPKHSNS